MNTSVQFWFDSSEAGIGGRVKGGSTAACDLDLRRPTLSLVKTG